MRAPKERSKLILFNSSNRVKRLILNFNYKRPDPKILRPRLKMAIENAKKPQIPMNIFLKLLKVMSLNRYTKLQNMIESEDLFPMM